jgi:hypothetical protein
MTSDPYTADARLCDDDGIVRQGAMHHGTNYPCTGHAHFAGEHYRCTSPAHTPKVAWIAGTNQRVCGNCGHPVDAPPPWAPNNAAAQATTYWVPTNTVAAQGPGWAATGCAPNLAGNNYTFQLGG